MRNVRFIGLDVHAATITIAVAESAGEVRGRVVHHHHPAREKRPP